MKLGKRDLKPMRRRGKNGNSSTVKPRVVADKDTDITAEDAAGEPEKKEEAKSAGSGSPPQTAAEGEKTYPDDPRDKQPRWQRSQWRKPR